MSLQRQESLKPTVEGLTALQEWKSLVSSAPKNCAIFAKRKPMYICGRKQVITHSETLTVGQHRTEQAVSWNVL